MSASIGSVVVACVIFGAGRHFRGEDCSRDKSWTPPRTPDGQPDLQGVWTNSTLTPLERPAELAGKAVLTEQEAADYVKRLLQQVNTDRRDGGAQIRRRPVL